ncbi:cytochrome P450 2U1-like [Xenia sp. Carnegie-2017]|uniref:cytochrome P450 2U1-like n=1 Tax=Xenia sp. Carnegie-2017 TaxID=2897299 RepID=UPI001F04C0CA|nr:cytochrome P450 2U1-like [Xenia sp. Carnegie-2017]
MTAVSYVIPNVLVGGTDTVSTTMEWFMLIMILQPDLQKKIQEQIDDVVGRDQLPSLKDASNMPLLEATICEVLRYITVLPMTSRSVTKNTVLNGFTIKKYNPLLANFYQVHPNPKVWENSEEFRPERFMDGNGKFVGWSAFSQFVLFTEGRRICIGMAQAKVQLLLISSSFLYRFNDAFLWK